uniref:Uncharacterized protein n=1 Tax=Romanomermis culicivorax TaxID=13658 RepID=A0A915KRT4_ROMCU
MVTSVTTIDHTVVNSRVLRYDITLWSTELKRSSMGAEKDQQQRSIIMIHLLCLNVLSFQEELIKYCEND